MYSRKILRGLGTVKSKGSKGASIHVLYVGRSWCTVRLLVSLMIKSINGSVRRRELILQLLDLERHFVLSFAI